MTKYSTDRAATLVTVVAPASTDYDHEVILAAPEPGSEAFVVFDTTPVATCAAVRLFLDRELQRAEHHGMLRAAAIVRAREEHRRVQREVCPEHARVIVGCKEGEASAAADDIERALRAEGVEIPGEVDLTTIVREMHAVGPHGAMLVERDDVEGPGLNGCTCYECLSPKQRWSRMVLCRTCGNKRCPHATHHVHACTGSNDVGQAGSRYA